MDPRYDLCLDSRIPYLCTFSSDRLSASSHSKRTVYCACTNQSAYRLGQPCNSCQPRRCPENLRHNTDWNRRNNIFSLLAPRCPSICILYHPQNTRKPVVCIPRYLGGNRGCYSQHSGTTELHGSSHFRICRTRYFRSSANGTTKQERIARQDLRGRREII